MVFGNNKKEITRLKQRIAELEAVNRRLETTLDKAGLSDYAITIFPSSRNCSNRPASGYLSEIRKTIAIGCRPQPAIY